jgi:hypothetical protein
VLAPLRGAFLGRQKISVEMSKHRFEDLVDLILRFVITIDP